MRKVRIACIGGGITGQLVQFNIPETQVYDWQPTPRRLTRSMGANYLWEPLEGIPCRQFKVITHVDGATPTLEAVERYKQKIGKTGDVAGWERQFQPEMDGYDFTELPAARIQYGHRVEFVDRIHHQLSFAGGVEPVQYDHLVSTIPLFALLSMLEMRVPNGGLRFKPIYFKITARPPDAPYPVETMYVNYLSSPMMRPYRYCDRFGERHFESIVPFSAHDIRRFTPGKIYAHAAVPAILEELAGFNIQTFGRYGSWQSDELVHETFKNIREWKRGIGL